jgi:hypothetical protein
MGVIRSLALAAILAFSLTLAACGSSEMTPDQQKELQEFWAASSLRFHFQTAGTGEGSNIVSGESDKPAIQVMVRGTVKAPDYAGGTITLEIREAEACADGFCPAAGKAPLAASSIAGPGFFSLVVPSKSQKSTLIASGGGKSTMLYLGELASAVNDAVLTLK